MVTSASRPWSHELGGAAAEDMVLQLAATKLTVAFGAAAAPISHNCVVVFGRGRARPAIAASLQ